MDNDLFNFMIQDAMADDYKDKFCMYCRFIKAEHTEFKKTLYYCTQYKDVSNEFGYRMIRSKNRACRLYEQYKSD